MFSRFAQSLCAAILLLSNAFGIVGGFGGGNIAGNASRMPCCHQACCSGRMACGANGACRMAMKMDGAMSAGARAHTGTGEHRPCIRSGGCGGAPAWMVSPTLDPAVIARTSISGANLLTSRWTPRSALKPANFELALREEPPRA